MGELTHKAARAAFGGAIDLAMRKMDKDREKGLLDLVDLTERFMGDNFQKSSYEGARKMIQDPDSKWMSYVNRALDEICLLYTSILCSMDFGFSLNRLQSSHKVTLSTFWLCWIR